MKKRAGLLAIFLIAIFANLVSSINVNVNSPINNGVYASNPVAINASSNEVVNWTTYLDGVQIFEAVNTNTFIYSTSPTKDVNHTLIISASNSSATVNTTISFYVDTLFPNITSQTPADNSNVSRGNIPFSVGYTEANLNYTKLYWKNSSDSSYKENVTDCGSGTCLKTIDFSLYSYGVNISYYFSLVDKLSRRTNGSVYTFKIIECIPNWTLETSWSSCSNGYRHQNYYDSNNCGNDTGKPLPLNETCCAPNCQSKECGSDGCGGSCGTCGTGYSCVDGSCSSDSSGGTQDTDTEDILFQNLYYSLTTSQINNGSLKTLKRAGDKITFRIKNESHSLVLTKMFSNKISIKISSSEQYTNLTLNEVNKFDLTADKYYDISVMLKRLSSSEADIFLIAINEKVPEKTSNATITTTNTSAENVSIETNNITAETLTLNETEKEAKFASRITGALSGAFKNIRKVPFYFVVAFAIFILGLVATAFTLRKKRKRRKLWGFKLWGNK